MIQNAADAENNNPESRVDTGIIELDSEYLDCSNKYDLTSINGINTIILDNPLCIIEHTGYTKYDIPSGRRLQDAAPTTAVELKYSALSVKGIAFGANLFQDTLYNIIIESTIE